MEALRRSQGHFKAGCRRARPCLLLDTVSSSPGVHQVRRSSWRCQTRRHDYRVQEKQVSYCTGKQDGKPMTPGRACELASHQVCFKQPKLRLIFLTYPPQSIRLTRGIMKEVSVTASRTTCNIPDAYLSSIEMQKDQSEDPVASP